MYHIFNSPLSLSSETIKNLFVLLEVQCNSHLDSRFLCIVISCAKLEHVEIKFSTVLENNRQDRQTVK